MAEFDDILEEGLEAHPEADLDAILEEVSNAALLPSKDALGMLPLLEDPLSPELPPEEPSAVEPPFIAPPLYPVAKRRGPRPELVMGIIAALAAALLLGVFVLCMPYFPPAGISDDPEVAIRQEKPLETEPFQETDPDSTAETEPESTTIPPDPNPYGRNDFQYNSRNYLLLQNLESWAGVDVSAYQGTVDWQKVAASGIEFAIIRLGYRGYESGKLVEDECAQQNLKGASDAGLKVGAYFFSQALNIEEAQEEIDFLLEILGEQYLDMPIVLDWEIPVSHARTANMDARTLTDIQLYFCEKMEALGYQPMVYFSKHQAKNLYYLYELEQAPFWLAWYSDRMDFPWKVEMWQYTDKGRVPGIRGDVDLNVYMPD